MIDREQVDGAWREPETEDMRTARLAFATALYGDRYAAFLLVSLHSCIRTQPGARFHVYHHDVSTAVLGALRRAFPAVQLHPTPINVGNSTKERFTKKTILLEQAVHTLCVEADYIVLVDCDMLYLRSIAPFLTDFDVAITVKDERFTMNCGVVLVRGNAAGRAFVTAWREKTAAICSDWESLSRSLGPPYGGPEQMAVHLITNYNGPRDYVLHERGQTIRLSCLPCHTLNETNSVPVTDDKHILHYKAGWHRMLLDGIISRHRGRHESREMYALFLRTYADAIGGMAAAGVGRPETIFKLHVPSYLDPHTLRESSIGYLAHVARSETVRVFGGLKRRLRQATV